MAKLALLAIAPRVDESCLCQTKGVLPAACDLSNWSVHRQTLHQRGLVSVLGLIVPELPEDSSAPSVHSAFGADGCRVMVAAAELTE